MAFALLGLGAIGASTVFEPFRPYLSGIAALLLAYGFYRVYFRREKCASVESCETKPASKLNQAFLWTAAIAVFAVAALKKPSQPAVVAPAIITTESEADKTAVIEVEGMTCKGGAEQINKALRKMKGVISAEASFQNKNARVVYNEKQNTLDEIKRIIAEKHSGKSPCEEVREIVRRRLAELDERMRQMRVYRRELAATLAEWDEAEAIEGDICGLIEGAEIEHPLTAAQAIGKRS